MTGSAKDRPIGADERPPGVPEAPPATVEELRALMLRIARGEAGIAMGAKAHRALGQILELRGDPALLSITTLAERLGINPSTITRLARTLGYSGFGGLQEVLLNASMSPPGAFYTRQAQTALAGGGGSSEARAVQLCRENQANIDRLVEGFDAEAFDRAVALIVGAPRVAVHGVRQFHAFASFLVYGLRMIRSDVGLLDDCGLGTAERIAAMGGDDLLISASCAPYTAQVVETAHAAAEKGIGVVAITDSLSSPLVAASRVALFAPHATSFLSNSLTTFILAAECLINGCAAARPGAAEAALTERDRMIKRLGIEI